MTNELTLSKNENFKEPLVFPIPLSDGHVMCIKNLPRELKQEDAEKIARVVLALADPSDEIK